MTLKRIVPESVVNVAVATVLSGLLGTLLLYAMGQPLERLYSYFFAVPGYAVLAMIMWYAYGLPRAKEYSLLPLLPWCPAIIQITDQARAMADTIVKSSPHINALSVVGILQSFVLLVLVLLLFVAVRSAFELARKTAAEHSAVVETPQPPSESRTFVPEPTPAAPIATDVAAQLRVIESVRLRSRHTSDNARLSMIVMIVLVLIGGGASVGLWFFGQVDRIRAIEIERNKLLGVSSLLEQLGRGATGEQAGTLRQLSTFVQNNYGQTSSYETLLRQIAERTQTSWPDIAIRATVAILTLFLVQIFFAVYKYSEHLSNLLAAKAEALDLLNVTPEDRENLRKVMLATVREATPGFTPGPNAPLQEMLEIIDKLKQARAE